LNNPATHHKTPSLEFIILMAIMTSLVPLSVNTVLPALSLIAQDLAVQQANNIQLVLSTLFLGMAAGQMIYGPISDSLGRKKPIYIISESHYRFDEYRIP